jgi:hypothetical protein
MASKKRALPLFIFFKQNMFFLYFEANFENLHSLHSKTFLEKKALPIQLFGLFLYEYPQCCRLGKKRLYRMQILVHRRQSTVH